MSRGEIAVRARGLRFAYPGGRAVLQGLDLDVRHGERVAILGPNGAGKTTLMLHLNGLLQGDGELRVAGLAPSDRRLRAHARGERVHRAMAARGWRGAPPAAGPAALRRADVAFAALVAGVPLATRLALEVGA